MSTSEELDRDGFTAAERAYFASGGKVTEGLITGENPVDDEPAPAPTADAPAPAVEQAASPEAPTATDPNADPFDDLDKVIKDNRSRTHKLIPEANFRVVSEKYKSTKKERDELRQRLEALEGNSKTWQEELNKEREMRARIDERLKLFNEVIAPPAEQPAQRPAPPNPEEDIFGYMKWLEQENQRRYEELAERVGQTTQTIQSEREETNLRTTYQQDAARFAQSNPDFAAAYNHLNKVRDAMLARAGYDDPKVREQIRLNEERDLVAQTIKSGKSPAEIVYSIAKELGYVTPAAPAATTTTTQAATPAAPSVTAEIERLQKAQAASKTLSTAGGSAPAAMTVQQLAAMDDAEFERFARKNPTLVKQLMGG